MARSELMDVALHTVRDHGFHALRVGRVVRETEEAASFVLEVPDELSDRFAYRAGQFCNFRIEVGGESHMRCYSMSSSPAVDTELQVTVKRVPGGVVSNWFVDHLAPGDLVEVSPPTGFFQLTPVNGDVVAFAAGSGITPVISLLKTVLATTTRRARLLYANRDRQSVIFAAELEAMAADHPDRFQVVHHLDVERGFVGDETVTALAHPSKGSSDAEADRAEFYVCGPEPFMDRVERALVASGVEAARVHIERFTGTGGPTADPPAAPEQGAEVTVELGGRTGTTEHRPGTTILQTARQLGLNPPSSCEAGNCATCMAKVVEGAVSMQVNNALTKEEVDEGWVLTCQGVPASETVRVVYDFEEG
ncbi:MAG TPA: ferredoxin--NADP reductase [Acidimicrobiales bacterium]|nr:ferredoxin--NADP reductase [Acidimicrobiales bacterium]